MDRTERTGQSALADRQFMGLALRLAKRMLGRTAPNPAVGAVIVDENTGELIACGWTQPGGRPHAETHVIERAGAAARGRTMYVSLEPCSHHGATPPCAEAILAAGVKRVVCAIEDPNPEVSGRGLVFLRRAGVAVDVGVCAEDARWMAAGHILRMTRQRPFVQLKLAVSSDGLIARGEGRPRWVTGPEARALGHLLRARSDAILVGRKTVEEDDPELTCRLPGLEGRSPRRLILDSAFRTPASAKLLRTARRRPVTIFGTEASVAPKFPVGVAVKRVPADDSNRLSLDAVLGCLYDDSITRLLVEGGPTVAQSFLAQDLVDEAVIFRGNAPLADGDADALDPGLGVLCDTGRWHVASDRRIGADRVTVYRALNRFTATTQR